MGFSFNQFLGRMRLRSIEHKCLTGNIEPIKTAEIIDLNQQNKSERFFLWAGDTIAVKFFYNEELNDQVTIRPDGKISLQLIGEIQAAGLTPSQLETLLRHEYSKVLYAGDVPGPDGPAAGHGRPDVLTVGSIMAVKFFYTPELNDEVTIRPDGNISLQLLDEVKAAGLTPAQLDALLTREYAKVLYRGDVIRTDGEQNGESEGDPPQSSYVLAIGNKVAVKFAYYRELDDEVLVRPDGKLSLKMIGDVQAAGLTPEQLDSLLTAEYAKLFYPGGIQASSEQTEPLEPLDLLSRLPYVLSVGDRVAVKFYYNNELNDEVVIRPDGKISLERIGDVKAAGLTTFQLDALLTEKYSEFLESPEVAVIVRDFKAPDLTVIVKDFKVPELTVVAKDIKLPDVTVEVTKPAAQKVYVGGQVAKPGMMPMVGMLRMHDTVIQAGGALDAADLERVVLIRYNGSPEPDVYSVNLKKIIAGKMPDVMLRPYDVIHLPKTAIAEVNTFAKQYIHGLIPVNFNLIYNINREVEVTSR
jgi:protein involved in polysaccharide export with SLBB domain